MGVEIERKFIVSSPDWRQGSYYFRSPESITQGYLAPGVRVRLVDADKAYLTVKGKGNGITRPEFEYEIPRVDGEQMLELCEHSISKVRHPILYFGSVWSVDEFRGDNYGLVLAEIELKHEDDIFDRPPWLCEETTLSNYDLAVKPWRYR